MTDEMSGRQTSAVRNRKFVVVPMGRNNEVEGDAVFSLLPDRLSPEPRERNQRPRSSIGNE